MGSFSEEIRVSALRNMEPGLDPSGTQQPGRSVFRVPGAGAGPARAADSSGRGSWDPRPAESPKCFLGRATSWLLLSCSQYKPHPGSGSFGGKVYLCGRQGEKEEAIKRDLDSGKLKIST